MAPKPGWVGVVYVRAAVTDVCAAERVYERVGCVQPSVSVVGRAGCLQPSVCESVW